MAERVFVSYTVQVDVWEEDGHFVAETTPFHLTVYGKTEDEAEQRALFAVDLLLKPYVGKLDTFTRYLNRRGVKHAVQTQEGETRRPTLRTAMKCIRDRELEFAGAGQGYAQDHHG